MAASSDDSDDDNFITLGTPVPEFDEGIQQKKPTTVQDLTAKDKQGRRRFHGAFTGGFSAGYFNTVGTKEGFTPSTFISSRSKRNETAGTRPEDFMDDEDLEEHGIAPRKFATVESYTSEERKRKRFEEIQQLTSSSSLNFGASLGGLIIPELLPVGMKLLRKMGWREGQGLGPRVQTKSKKKKKKTPLVKPGVAVRMYGCAPPPSASEESDSDDFVPENMSDVTFAPKDVTPISLDVKDNVHGLGYRGLDPSLALPGSHVNLFGAPPVRSSKGGKGIRGQAFGVGAFEDEDEDIYAVDNMSNYDITMQLDEENDNKYGWTAPREHGKQVVPVSYVGKLLEGFALSSKPLKPKKKFPPPTLPRHFKPQHWFRKKRVTSHIPEGLGEEQADSKPAAQLSAVDRGLMLGETPLMGSVFDLVPKEDQNRIEATKQAIAMTRSLTHKVGTDLSSKFQPAQTERERMDTVKEWSATAAERPADTDSHRDSCGSKFKPAEVTPVQSAEVTNEKSKVVGQKAPLFQGNLSFQPFRKDPAKQARYDKYLAAAKQGVPDPYAAAVSGHMTEWERARERDEFSKAAKIFRPMSALMSSRFVGGSLIDDDKAEDAVHPQSEKSDQAKAADLKMFGKLTREEFEWHPDKLLCRRFNVPNPYPGSDLVGLPTVKRDKYSIFNFLSFGDYQPRETQEPSSSAQTPDSESHGLKKQQPKKPTMASVFQVLDDPEFHKQTFTVSDDKSTERTKDGSEEKDLQTNVDEDEEAAPDMDLFRAVFKNSDSETSSDENPEDSKDKSDEDEEEEEKTEENNEENEKETKMQEDEKGKQPQERANTSIDEMTSQPIVFKSSATPDQPGGQEPSKRFKTRWGQKSVFSVLEHMDNEGQAANPETGSRSDEIMSRLAAPESSAVEEISAQYGPSLPPASACSTHSNMVTSGQGTHGPSADRTHRKEKHSRDTSEGRHKHKKDKKKKSKHKKNKKHKKHRKSRKSSRREAESSGSEADTESESDESDVPVDQLLKKLKEVSGSGKSIEAFKHL